MRNTIIGFVTGVLHNFAWTPGALGFGIVILFGLGTGHIMLSKGEIPQIFAGYVPRTEFVELMVTIDHMRDKQDSAERSRLRGDLRTEQRRLCQSITRGGDVEIYDEHISELQESYMTVNGGARFDLNRNCNDMGAG